MTTIDPRNSTSPTNPQLAGILALAPMPAAIYSNVSSTNVGALPGSSFSVPQPTSGTSNGQVLIGSGGSMTSGVPSVGAQPTAPTTDGTIAAGPAAPPATTGAGATTTSTPTIAPATTGSPLAEAISGFGKASRNERIEAAVDGASFGFPSFNSTKSSTAAPAITWGSGWTKVQKDGLWYMQHTNGVRAVPAVEYRLTPSPIGSLQMIRVANGWGKRFPNGSVLVIDRKEGPYLLDTKGNKRKLGLGTHTIGGVKIRLFEASVVRTIDKDGKVDVFDSRGNKSTGTTRWTNAPLGSADAGASIGGGKTTGGGSVDLTPSVQKLTAVARGLLDEVRSGSVDPERLVALQAQLATLPAAILQAIGAAGSLTSSGTTTSGGGVTPAPPVAGVDANATTKELLAGASTKLDASVIPSDLQGMQARFAQLPDDLQAKIAAAFGSDQGTRALRADQLLAFDKDGTVRMVEGGTLYTRHQAQVMGGGPGEDLVMTMRPNRQPGSSSSTTALTTPAEVARPATSGSATGGGDVNGASAASAITLFPSGGELRHEDLGGLDGTYTWKTLPAAAKGVILSLLRSGSNVPAATAFASRTGSGWSIDPATSIVIAAGYAQFPAGMVMHRAASTPSTIGGGAPGSGPSNQSGAHDATIPPVSSGGVAVAPPAPPIADHGSHAGHAGSVGSV